MEKAAFGAGCFWGVEEAFRTLPGVVKTTVGYQGGHTQNPTYKDVCSGATGHAETVLVEFDPAQVGYDRLLAVFFANHNPTEVDRQGPDVGTQYRSVIFTYGEAQEETAKIALEKLSASGTYKKPVATQILPAPAFYPAEDYHQQYLQKRGLTHCHT